jgi:hypothetical protein
MKKTKRVPEDTLRIFPPRIAGVGKTYQTFVSEMAEIMEAKNLGQSGEAKKIAMLKKSGVGGKGSSLSGRGSDAYVDLHTKGDKKQRFTLELKEKGAAFGQVGLRYHPKRGWHYRAEEVPPRPVPKVHPDSMTPKQRKSWDKKVNAHTDKVREVRAGRAIAKTLHGLKANEIAHSHYGVPRGGGARNHIEHARKKKELHVEIATSPHHIARVLRKTMNDNDLVHISGHGVYSLHPHVSKKTGIPYIGDHIDHHAAKNGDVLSVRHRVKTHKSAKDGKPASQTMTAQVNFDKEFLRPSHITLDMAKKKGHKVGTLKENAFVPLDFSTPEAAARSMKEMERRRGTEAMAADRSYRGNRSSVSLVTGVRKSKGVKRIKYRPPEGRGTK